jgi:nucleoside-diphosphate-sugar epimerase
VGRDFGSSNFLFGIIREACDDQMINLHSTPDSAKDYIVAEDVVSVLISLAEHPDPKPIYNIASGCNVKNKAICGALAKITGCSWHVETEAPLLEFPHIDVSRARNELDLVYSDVLQYLPDLVNNYRT